MDQGFGKRLFQIKPECHYYLRQASLMTRDEEFRNP
jgi:hypothetical protein